MSFKWDNNELLRIYKEIFKDINRKIDKERDGEHTYGNNYGIYIKLKVDEERIYFHGNKASKENTN